MNAAEPVQHRSYAVRGQEFEGWLADGSNGAPAPGVLLFHEGGGLTRHTKRAAARLAEAGMIAYAADLFGETGLALDRAREMVQKLRTNTPLLRARCEAALRSLRTYPNVDPRRLAAIGYCFGGAAAVELARTGADLRAVIGFHAGILPAAKDENRAIRAAVLLCHGAADPVVPRAQIDAFVAELEEVSVRWQLNLYGGVGHSFTNPDIDDLSFPGFSYHAGAAESSWQAMLQFLDESFISLKWGP